MRQFLSLGGSICGAAGALTCVSAGAARLAGSFYLGGLETNSLFSLGVGLMVLGCLLKLELLTREGD